MRTGSEGLSTRGRVGAEARREQRVRVANQSSGRSGHGMRSVPPITSPNDGLIAMCALMQERMEVCQQRLSSGYARGHLVDKFNEEPDRLADGLPNSLHVSGPI
jgi:hypothetical protein